MPYLPDTAVDVLRAMQAELCAVRVELRAQRQALELLAGGAAPDVFATLVAAVYAVAGLREFASAELIGMSHLGGVPELALRQLLGDRNAIAVGLLLTAAAGQVCADSGLVLVFVRKARQGKIWRVSPTRTLANR